MSQHHEPVRSQQPSVPPPVTEAVGSPGSKQLHYVGEDGFTRQITHVDRPCNANHFLADLGVEWVRRHGLGQAFHSLFQISLVTLLSTKPSPLELQQLRWQPAGNQSKIGRFLSVFLDWHQSLLPSQSCLPRWFGPT